MKARSLTMDDKCQQTILLTKWKSCTFLSLASTNIHTAVLAPQQLIFGVKIQNNLEVHLENCFLIKAHWLV